MSQAADSYGRRSLTPSHIINRVAAALLGGYAFTWGFCALAMTVAVSLGAGFHDAEQGAYLLAFLVFLAVFLWAFACAHLPRVWLTLAGGGAAMTATAWALQNSILS